MIDQELITYFEKADKFEILEAENQAIVHFSIEDSSERDRLFIKDNMLMFVLEGNQSVATPNYFYKLEAGESIFVKKGSVIVCEKLRNGKNLECLLVFLTDDFLKRFIKEYLQMIAPSELLDINSLGAYQFFIDKWMNAYVHSVLSYFELSDLPPTKELISHKFRELLLLLISGQERSYFMSFLKNCLIENNSNLDNVVKTNMYTSLNVDHLARLSNLSLSQFKREFKKQYKDSPANWLRAKRLEHASHLLMTTSKNITEICYESGFNNTSHFCRLFSENYKMSPLKFRQQIPT
ncbi:helix-turn-helix domain-containing protein [Winogradskyella wichelsiae]|uniref:helix-turn-helix domain-containing protein n=1 Tax=Winogradskyella wichelsiae TaxID=2697007 RepID=UPI0015C9A65B|nr:response regulator transcription factor [Winogradskyella wichelsiae]